MPEPLSRSRLDRREELPRSPRTRHATPGRGPCAPGLVGAGPGTRDPGWAAGLAAGLAMGPAAGALLWLVVWLVLWLTAGCTASSHAQAHLETGGIGHGDLFLAKIPIQADGVGGVLAA